MHIMPSFSREKPFYALDCNGNWTLSYIIHHNAVQCLPTMKKKFKTKLGLQPFFPQQTTETIAPCLSCILKYSVRLTALVTLWTTRKHLHFECPQDEWYQYLSTTPGVFLSSSRALAGLPLSFVSSPLSLRLEALPAMSRS